MLHNNYFNNYIPNNMYYRPSPIYPPIEKKPINDKTVNIQDTIINDKSKECASESNTLNKDRLSLFGLSLNIDDIIIIGLIIFLFMENRRDYLLLIILGLMFFDISIDTFKSMNIVKKLFNPG
ncbi:MAG: hypothetical protein PHD15_00915 [Clostridia bacterium]|nr:hypothetical protein [Clostridia bacterium]MDD4386312.1 hypothetical protein [Clostridia bacterium]